MDKHGQDAIVGVSTVSAGVPACAAFDFRVLGSVNLIVLGREVSFRLSLVRMTKRG